jgi:signal peptidase I
MTSRKLVALVLALVGPWGIGHFHLGRRARALVWLAVPNVALVGLGAAVPALGPRLGWTAAAALPLLVMLAAWAASVVDLLVSREAEARAVWQTVAFACVGLAAPAFAAAFLRAFVLESFVVPTRSMEPSILAGDHLFAAARTSRPRYGDIVVFASPERSGQMLVKRVVAEPGDVLEVERGRPWINGWQVPSCRVGEASLGDANGELDVEFLGEASYLVFYDESAPVAEHAGPFYAATDGVLVLGDDRNDSADSRTWHDGRDGNVHAGAVRGRALFVWLRTSAIDDARFGVDLGHVVLPSSLARLRPALARCLATRPPSVPPRPLGR